MTKPRRRTMLAAAMAAALAATLLAGCAALNTMPAEISTWGDWPADRKPGRYAFDRLPSQAAPAPVPEWALTEAKRLGIPVPK